MAQALPNDVSRRLQSEAAAGRDRIEAELFPERPRRMRFRRLLLQAAGAVAIGVFAAGVSVFLAVIVLNLLFHYSPS